jgi:transposase
MLHYVQHNKNAGFCLFYLFCHSERTAPFPNSSGTSLRGKTKVSNLAYKKIKSLLDQCAKCAIQHNPEIRMFYKKRVEEGKDEMITINIIRNKILARIFAEIIRGTPYVDTLKYAA